jgi:3-oxoadipate enol-lactonase
MQFIDLNGIVIHFRTSGDASRPALVFSNSLGTDLRIWDRVASAFVEDFFVVCYDKRGHGLSTAPPPPYTIADHFDDLVNLMDALSITDAVICGDSVGGLIAQGVAARDTERVRALVLCDTAAKIGDTETWNPRIQAVEQGGIEAVADATMERWFTREFRSSQVAELTGWRNMLVRTPLAGYLGTMMAIRDADQTDDTDGLSIPALVVVGNEDDSTPPHVVKALSDLLDESEFHVIDDAGHLPCIEQPEVLVDLMRAFLQRNGLMP